MLQFEILDIELHKSISDISLSCIQSTAGHFLHIGHALFSDIVFSNALLEKSSQHKTSSSKVNFFRVYLPNYTRQPCSAKKKKKMDLPQGQFNAGRSSFIINFSVHNLHLGAKYQHCSALTGLKFSPRCQIIYCFRQTDYSVMKKFF